MALSILDGNQSAATLSTILTGGAHIPAHTVVSLGTQAVSDITSAVSGVSVSISGTQTTTFGAISGNVSVLNFPSSQGVTFGATTGSVSILNFPSTQTVAGTVTVGSLPAISGSVTVNNFPSTQAIAGTVTANLQQNAINFGIQDFIGDYGYFPVDVGTLPSISGTVTANVINSVTIGSLPAVSGTVTANVQFSASLSGVDVPAPMQGIALGYLTDSETFFRPVHEDQGLPVRIQGQSATQPISGTVTANNPSGALTTRFGSVVTANLAAITSAVTNTSRKYLLAQNISAGTVTIGIGFSPTTTQGIQLTAGAGLTFDAFCPTGAVYWLGAVTGAAYTILEG